MCISFLVDTKWISVNMIAIFLVKLTLIDEPNKFRQAISLKVKKNRRIGKKSQQLRDCRCTFVQKAKCLSLSPFRARAKQIPLDFLVALACVAAAQQSSIYFWKRLLWRKQLAREMPKLLSSEGARVIWWASRHSWKRMARRGCERAHGYPNERWVR